MRKKNSPENSIIVMKFGGTSVRSEEARASAVEHIRRNAESGSQVVVVVSAMGRKGEPYATDTLISLLKDLGEPVNPAELDAVMSLGETLSSAFFSHLLSQNNLPAQAFTGQQAGILTDDNPGNAEILKINPTRIRSALNAGKIAVVAGFQGATSAGDVRTLGRGGSDTSAVALASALNAEKVEIYSDVDGIANCDPRQIAEAVFMDKISAAQILSMANEGSKVIHPRAIKAALQTQTPIVARNTFSNAQGTTIFHSTADEETSQAALAHRDEMCLLVFEANADADELIPELIRVDERRFVLKNDVYLESRIKELQKKFGKLRQENGWATISVVFDKAAAESILIADTEKIPAGNNVISYLLKEDCLRSSLETLYGHYILAE
ncbi:MAG: aspartate kinase [SAR324 cluster bacterium]|nr:aspartate kinase [SAR324 cluster bacterium]MBL7035806.1 aspartate kinase [SAR324 cluster bacterium]